MLLEHSALSIQQALKSFEHSKKCATMACFSMFLECLYTMGLIYEYLMCVDVFRGQSELKIHKISITLILCIPMSTS